MGARVLVVEDTPHNLELMTYLLEAHGHTVMTATTGEQAVELAVAQPPDLVVMDLQLPGMDGYQALTALRSRPPLAATPVVAVTSFAMLGDRKQVLNAGFDDYLAKPISPETFADEIDARLPEPLRGQARAPGAAGAQPAAPATRDPARTHKILLLDDSPINLALLCSMLEPQGYEVTTATTVEEAIAAVDRVQPDLVLCDIHLGGKRRGSELLRHLRSGHRTADVPFAFMTATADPLEALERESRTLIIRRPIELRQLLDKVAALLNRSDRQG